MRAAIVCAIACAMLALQAEAALTTVTKYTTITEYKFTGMPNSDSPAATATASDSAFASASASGSRSVVEDDATGEISSAPPAATSMPAADMSGSVDPEKSGAEILSQKPIMATGTAKAGPSVSGSNGLFTFTPLTLAPEKSKGVATASQNVAIASKPAVASAHTSDAGLMSLNNMAIAAVAAVAGLAML